MRVSGQRMPGICPSSSQPFHDVLSSTMSPAGIHGGEDLPMLPGWIDLWSAYGDLAEGDRKTRRPEAACTQPRKAVRGGIVPIFMEVSTLIGAEGSEVSQRARRLCPIRPNQRQRPTQEKRDQPGQRQNCQTSAENEARPGWGQKHTSEQQLQGAAGDIEEHRYTAQIGQDLPGIEEGAPSSASSSPPPG